MAEPLIYGARSLAEQRRNQAKLGARWDAKPLTDKELRCLPRYPARLSQREAVTRAWWDGFFIGWFWRW